MELVHVELKEANAVIDKLHRHHKAVTGHRFSIGAKNEGILVGVAIIGRPVARMTDQKNIVEVLRLCTDGTKNACSFLYGASAKAAKALDYLKIQTFILEEEPGTSLKASGWVMESFTSGGEWSRQCRNRPKAKNTSKKQKWVKYLARHRN